MIIQHYLIKFLFLIIGTSKAVLIIYLAEGINEHWREILERLDQLSTEYAKELQAETKRICCQENEEIFDIWRFPPHTLLARNLILVIG